MKLDLGCEQGQKLLSIVLTGGQRGDSPQFIPVPAGILYKLRNVVERCFNRLRQFRGLATRFAKRAAYHRSEIILSCIVRHLR
ncbi:hypothetical protein P3102_20795 [Amycolatopsis sp. QT-25]|uniref:hypothetical protein n=1 Tax=Amycolatopsis sp. QT-25 TaxID=3034022 RepID=UPI0023EAB591|nr:hypothetical protein [Amycolatopsis sp. QT-25]WET76561.1 hypothetical protein P3102_20795 [Amycolatopsis sp. QT-25]